MTGDDLKYIEEISTASYFSGPVLELEGGYGDITSRHIVRSRGLDYWATDLSAAPGVDLVANFETGEGLTEILSAGPFGTVLVLNVLEHTFDPVSILDNALRVMHPDRGCLVALAPAVWPLHNFPVDCCRLLPDWYRRFAETRGLSLLDETFQYVGYGRVAGFRTSDGQDHFPEPGSRRPVQRLYSRVIHRLFNTYGRGMIQPAHVAVAGVFLRGSPVAAGGERSA